jgi:hypothetical protein
MEFKQCSTSYHYADCHSAECRSVECRGAGRNNCQNLFDFNFLNKSLKQGLAGDIF